MDHDGYDGSKAHGKKFYDDFCIFESLCCVYVACGPEIGWRGQSELCCIKKTFCFEPCFCNNAKSRLLGVDCSPSDPSEFCKIGLYCCDYSCIYPRVCIGIAGQVLCLREVGAFPCHEDYLDNIHFALYCVQCLPKCACAAPPPRSPAFDALQYSMEPAVQADVMDRGEIGGYSDKAEAGNETEMV